MQKCYTLTGQSVLFKPEYFEQFISCYKEAIPPSERESDSIIQRLVSQNNYFCILLIDENDRVCGFSLSYFGRDPNYVLLGYMGVTATRRSRGYGSLMMNILKREFSDFDIIVEVDSIRENAEDLDQRRKRVRFYQRNGAYLVDGFEYIMPLDIPGFPAPDMDLMIIPQHSQAGIKPEHFNMLLESIYTDVYELQPSDPRIRQMSQTVPETGYRFN